MPLRKFILKTVEKDRGKRLDQVLADWLPAAASRELSKAKIRKLVVAGAVYLNGKRVRIASKTILPNARIEVFVDFEKLESDGRSRDRVFQFAPSDILYEDDAIIVVDKPPGLPTQPTLDESRDNLFAILKKYLAAREKVADPYLGLHHRLDRDTSGVILFTKQKEANKAVSDLFAGREARKTYLALVPAGGKAGLEPGSRWTVKNHLGRAPGAGKKARFAAVRSGGDFAHTDFTVLERAGGSLLVQCEPHTGRTHQIRVHLAGEGLPILGDTHYGGSGKVAARVMLHAFRLEFPHPLSGVRLTIEAPLPADFSDCLKKLKGSGA